MNKHYQKMRKQAGLAGAVMGSLLIINPAMAMPRMEASKQLAQANPHPSIFNEPPYNRRSTSDTAPSSGTPPMMQPMPESGTTSPSTSPSGQSNPTSSSSSPSTDPTSPQNPNQPATNPSPYLQQQQTGGSEQPSVPGQKTIQSDKR